MSIIGLFRRFFQRRFEASRSGHKFEEVVRLNKFQKNILGVQGIKAKVKDIDLRGYAKYLLKEGSPIEKREFLSCMKSKFTLARKIVTIEK